jgi:hypothetical protein
MSLFNKIHTRLFADTTANVNRTIIKNWEKAGKPAPPPHVVKQLSISNLQAEFKYSIFIETGTYLGEMIEAQMNNFSHIFSIELSERLYLDALNKFENNKNVTILQGDSGEVLVAVCAQLDQPAIFWLDGHYSAGITAKGKKQCPIYEELSAIFNANHLPHILLIDDARLFVGENDYPTISELSSFILSRRPLAKINCENDVIQVSLTSLL